MDSDDSNPLDWEDWKGEIPFWQHALCGSTAGVMEHLSLFPLDTIKTRLQIGFCKCTNVNNVDSSPLVKEGPTITLRNNKLISHGYKNLFRGSNIIVVGCIPAHVLYFTVYEHIKRTGNVAIAGATATVCHDFVLTPADVIKQRLQLGCYKGSLHCLSSIIKHEGYISLFRSLTITLFMNVPYHTLLVTVMEMLKKRYKTEHNINYFIYAGKSMGMDQHSKHNITSLRLQNPGFLPQYQFLEIDICYNVIYCLAACRTSTHLFIGIGGAVAGALTTPMDVIKTRLQTQSCRMKQENKPFRPVYKNVASTASTIFKDGGFRGFWKGTSTRIGICIPAAAISWGTYESLKNLIKVLNIV